MTSAQMYVSATLVASLFMLWPVAVVKSGKLNNERKTKFKAIIASSGSSMCAADNPSEVNQARSLIKCYSVCLDRVEVCLGFNFRKGAPSSCELFANDPVSFINDATKNCQLFLQVFSIREIF